MKEKRRRKRYYLLDLCVIGSGDELLEIGETFGASVGVDQFCLDVRISSLLSRHLQVSNQILPVI